MSTDSRYTGRGRTQRRRTILSISLSAVFVALAVALEVIGKALPFLQLPQGGSISLTCLPLILASLTLGPGWGTACGALYGLINFLIDGYAFSWGSFIFDYVLAFAMMGLAGIFSRPFLRERMYGFILGSILAMLGRYLSHCVSGAVFFADYAPEGVSAILYSFVLYNLPYCAGSLILDLAVGAAIFYPYQRLLSVNSIHSLFSGMEKRGYSNAASKVLSSVAQGNLDTLSISESVRESTISLTQAQALMDAVEVSRSSEAAVQAVNRLWSKGGRFLPLNIRESALAAARGGLQQR